MATTRTSTVARLTRSAIAALRGGGCSRSHQHRPPPLSLDAKSRLFSIFSNNNNSFLTTFKGGMLRTSYACSYSTAAKSSGQDQNFGKQLLRKLQLSEKAMKDAVQSTCARQRVTDQDPEGKSGALEKYWIDLTERARRGELAPVLGRDDEIQRCIQIMSQETKNNPVIIGQPGKERTEIAEGLAQLIVRGEVSETLANRKLISLDMGSFLAGANSRDDFEERLRVVLKHITATASNGRIILFIDDFRRIADAGSNIGMTGVGYILKSMLGQGELRCIAATTLREYRIFIGNDLDLNRRFQKVMCDNLSIIWMICLFIADLSVAAFY